MTVILELSFKNVLTYAESKETQIFSPEVGLIISQFNNFQTY